MNSLPSQPEQELAAALKHMERADLELRLAQKLVDEELGTAWRWAVRTAIRDLEYGRAQLEKKIHDR